MNASYLSIFPLIEKVINRKNKIINLQINKFKLCVKSKFVKLTFFKTIYKTFY